MTRPGQGPGPRPASGGLVALAHRHPVLSTVAFATLYGLAAWLSRETRLPGSQLALVWLAAPVAFVWLALSWGSRRRLAANVVALAATTVVINLWTGATPVMCVVFALANCLQAGVTCAVMARLRPDPWRLRTPRDLQVFLLGVTAGTAACTAVIPLGLWLVHGYDLLPTAMGYALRTASTTFVLAALALRLLDRGPRSLVPPEGRGVELAVAAAALVSSYALVFSVEPSLPLSYLLIPLTLWFALRFDASLTAAHVLVAGMFVVEQTLQGVGPFAVAEPLTRAVLAQSYVAVVGVIGLALSLLRDARQSLIDELAAANADAQSQAALLSTLLDTVQTTILACDADGRPLYANRAYVDAAGGAPGAIGPRPTARMHAADGTRLAYERWPLVRALRGEVVAEELLVGVPGGQLRTMMVHARTFCAPDGTVLGAVGSGHDVTALRASQQRFRSAFHDGPSPLAYLDDLGRVLDVNAAMRRCLALPTTRLVGHPLADLVHREDAARLRSSLTVDDEWGVRTRIEVRLLRVDGIAVWCEVATTRCLDADGTVYLLAQFVDIHVRKVQELALEAATRQDVLTGLANRQALTSVLTDLLDPTSGSAGAAVLFVDLDGFKDVNDTLGHDAGDAVLVEVATRLLSTVRPGDMVARIGGDEFVVACPAASAADLEPLAARVEQAVVAPIFHAGQVVEVGASAGCASALPGTAPQALLDAADRAMYRRKRERRDADAATAPLTAGSAPLARTSRSDLRLARSIATAVEEHRTSLVYQPVVDLATGGTVGAEVLLRMTDVDGAPVMPDQFLPVAEAHGLMAELTRWVLDQSFAQAADWKAALPDDHDFGVGVNVSPLQLRDGRIVDQVREALDQSGLAPDAVILEVTEGRLLPDAASVKEVLHGLRDLGVHLAIDDFGTGYASVNYLAAFPFDLLKVDRRYTRALAGSGDDVGLARGVYALATATGITTVAEGVETIEEHRAVVAAGCGLGQGYLWSRPVPPEDFARLLRPPVPEQRRVAQQTSRQRR